MFNQKKPQNLLKPTGWVFKIKKCFCDPVYGINKQSQLCSPGGSTILRRGLRALIASCYYNEAAQTERLSAVDDGNKANFRSLLLSAGHHAISHQLTLTPA